MSLPVAWVDRIFEKLALVYGRDFTSRWEGLDIVAVKTDWAHELGSLHNHPSMISHALANLPDRPPSVIDFRKIARTGPAEAPEQVAIEGTGRAYRASREQIAAELAKLEPVLRRGERRDPKEWAHKLIAKAARDPHSVSSLPLRMARAALNEPRYVDEGDFA